VSPHRLVLRYSATPNTTSPLAKGPAKPWRISALLALVRNTDPVAVRPAIRLISSDAVYRRVMAARAEIVIEIKDEDYGGQDFSCRDPEGHIRTWAHTILGTPDVEGACPSESAQRITVMRFITRHSANAQYPATKAAN
jgi:hypothetical protein